MDELIKMMTECVGEFDKTMEICDYAKGLPRYQFNVLVSMLFDEYAKEHEDYNILDNGINIIQNVYEVTGRNPRDDMKQ